MAKKSESFGAAYYSSRSFPTQIQEAKVADLDLGSAARPFEKFEAAQPFERRRLRVYVAGPMSADMFDGVQRGIRWGRQMFLDGLAPFIPHFDAFWFLPDGHWEQYLTYDLEWVSVSEAVFRLEGESRGADKECAVAEELGIPVYYESGAWSSRKNYNDLLQFAAWNLGKVGVK
jgi:hypothetical protein